MNHKTIFVTGGLKNRSPPALWPTGNFNQSAWGSELSRQIAVDLESDADLDEGRGCPGHWPFPSVFMNTARYIGSRSESNLRGAQFACDRTITAATSASIAAAALPQHLLPVHPRRGIEVHLQGPLAAACRGTLFETTFWKRPDGIARRAVVENGR
jgi:hypothetical protein